MRGEEEVGRGVAGGRCGREVGEEEEEEGVRRGRERDEVEGRARGVRTGDGI